MNENFGNSFLLICKQNYFDKVTPSNDQSRLSEGYQKASNIAKEYFRNGKEEEFVGFFQEGQYFIGLWAAHLLLEYSTSNNNHVRSALKVIKNYTDNPLALEVAKEEKEWLNANFNTYKEYLQ